MDLEGNVILHASMLFVWCVVHELKQPEYDVLCRTLYIKPEPLNEVDEANEDANDDEFGDVE